MKSSKPWLTFNQLKREPYQIPQPQQIKGAKKKAKPSTLSCESSQLQQKEKQQSGKKKYFQWVTATRYLNNFTCEHCRSHYHLFTAIQHIPPFPSLVTSCYKTPLSLSNPRPTTACFFFFSSRISRASARPFWERKSNSLSESKAKELSTDFKK